MKKVFQENLNPQQLEAVKHTDGPLLVVAVADAAIVHQTRGFFPRDRGGVGTVGAPRGAAQGLVFIACVEDRVDELVCQGPTRLSPC